MELFLDGSVSPGHDSRTCGISTKESVMMVNWRLMYIAALLVCLAATRGSAHGVNHTVTRAEAVVVNLFHESGETFSNVVYEIFGPGDTTPLFTGRTDELGQILFVPDRTGTWRIRAFSEDGHGANVEIEIDDIGNVTQTGRSPHGGLGIPLVGVLVIFALFGVLSFFLKKRKG
jgi:nickel transport protein